MGKGGFPADMTMVGSGLVMAIAAFSSPEAKTLGVS
jgi:hypothetical protein